MSGETWSTAQVARMSGVTSRTLRHYDDIGLLRPVAVGANGIRRYGRRELLRLQQILVLRDLGLSLEAIATVVTGRGDQVAQLRRHHRWLLQERDRVDRLARTVAATIEELEGGDTMRPEELFENFDPERQARYEAELTQRYGERVKPHIDESKRRMSRWTKTDGEQAKRAWTDFLEQLATALKAGTPVDDAEVQALIEQHYAWVCRFWTPDRESYPGLGQLYVDSPDFRAQFDAVDARLAEYLRDAMMVYAQARL